MELLSDVVNDLDVDFSANPAAAESHKNDQRNIRKIREATEKLKINIIHPLREGKRLLVLDIDYSLVTCSQMTGQPGDGYPLSDFGYKAPDFRCTAPLRMCTTSAA
jgi:hypothetical protein